MSSLTLHLDKKAYESIEKLKQHYGLTTQSEVIQKALALLKIAADLHNAKGELIAKSGDQETKITLG